MAKVLKLKLNGNIVFTRNYTTGFIFRKTYLQGSNGIVTRIHKGWFETSVDVRFGNGKVLRRVPIKYFEA